MHAHGNPQIGPERDSRAAPGCHVPGKGAETQGQRLNFYGDQKTGVAVMILKPGQGRGSAGGYAEKGGRILLDGKIQGLS
jgi:hypothetical protein